MFNKERIEDLEMDVNALFESVHSLRKACADRLSEQTERTLKGLTEIATRLVAMEKYLGIEFKPSTKEEKVTSPVYTKKAKETK